MGQQSCAVIHVERPQKRGDNERDRVRDAYDRLAEATALADAIDLDVVHQKILNLKKIEAGHFIGSGQVSELREVVDQFKLDLVIMNTRLSPVQHRNLERALNTKVIDRTALILEIFGERAATREGALQVEAAHLTYQKSRLVRSWTHLERQRGGAGFLGGPGETQIEADRRALDVQIQAIEGRIAQVRKTRELHRAGRSRADTPVVALVGYTNAGKSTLFNRLTDAGVVAEDMLFATLDPTMRRVDLPAGKAVIFSDTVGFISDLPTELVAAFRATLEEVLFADLILHIRDASNPDHQDQATDVYKVLRSIGVDPEDENINIIEVFNKIDVAPRDSDFLQRFETPHISALTGEGVAELLEIVERALVPIKIREILDLPFAAAQARAWLYENNAILNEDTSDQGYHFEVEWDNKIRAQFDKNFGPIQMNSDRIA